MNKSKTKTYIIGFLLIAAGAVSGQAGFMQTGFSAIVGGLTMTDEVRGENE